MPMGRPMHNTPSRIETNPALSTNDVGPSGLHGTGASTTTPDKADDVTLRGWNVARVFRWLRAIRRSMRKIITLLVTLILAVALFYVPWKELYLALISAHPLWLVVAALINVTVFPLWATQWRLLALPTRDIPWLSMFEIVAMSSIANHLLTSAAGATSAIILLIARGGMTAIGAGSLMMLDQLLVGVAKITLLLLAVALAPIPPAAVQWIFSFSALVLAFMVALLVLAVLHGRIELFLAHRGPQAWAVHSLLRLSRSLGAIRDPRLAASTVVLAIAKKATEVGAAYAVQLACGIEPSLTAAILAVAAVSVTTLVPIVPGNLGVYTAAVFAVYQSLGIPAAQGLAAGLLQQAADVVPSLFVGYGTLLVNKVAGKSDMPDPRIEKETQW